MDIWLERFGLAALVAIFVSLVVLNVMKFDTFQRVALGVGIVGLSAFGARTIQVLRAQTTSKLPESVAPSSPAPTTPIALMPSVTSQMPSQKPIELPKKEGGKPTEVLRQAPTEEATMKDKSNRAPQQPSLQINSAPGGFAISGGTINNPTVNNITVPTGRRLSEANFSILTNSLRKVQGTVLFVGYEPITKEMDNLIGQLQRAFQAAGWQAPAMKSSDGISAHRTVLDDTGRHDFVPDGIHCVGDSDVYRQVLGLLQSSGLNCENASKILYPPPDTSRTITIFVGRNTD